uniref:Selenoprotein J n=1 Tax=Oncorhynchus mykiss TaxID=8022 RepID=A0A8C7PXC6_ONCMY
MMASTVAERAMGAIIGAAVADAAAQPMHWIYNPERLKEVLSDLEPCPEFRPQSANPFYRRETGEQTCYGDQAYVLLESLSQCGDVNVEDLTKRIYKFFGPDTVYDLPLNNPYRQKNGPKAVLPIDGPWRNASLKAFMRNVDAGNEKTGCDVDCQMDGVTKMAPVVAMFAGMPEMLEKVETAIRVTQNNDMCVAMTLAAARFLEHFILNGSDPNALDSVLAQLNDPNRNNPQDLDRAVIGTTLMPLPLINIHNLSAHILLGLHPKWHPIPYFLPSFGSGPIELWSKVVHYLGNRVPFDV